MRNGSGPGSKPDGSNPFSAILPLVRQELVKCIRCGECRCACPVFQETFAERHTARGKMQIVQALATGELQPDDSVREALENCLLCTGCTAICTSNVRPDKVILAARAVFAEHYGTPFAKKLLGKVLAQPTSLLAAEARIGRLLQAALCAKVPETSGLRLRFATPFADTLQYIPEIAATPFTERYASPLSGAKDRVLFFTGCMANYAMTNIADSLVAVLNALGVEVIVPKDQGCCGTPMAVSGDVTAKERQAVKNAAAFAGHGDLPIVTACASCGHMLKHGYAEDFTGRVMDITEYLVGIVGEERLRSAVRKPSGKRVTYHDPCHLLKAQALNDEPRLLLSLATGKEISEMDNPGACCGLGGTYCLGNMGLSKRIQARKIADALRTEASAVATCCPGCMLQLSDGLRRHDAPSMRVAHVIELLRDAIIGDK